MDSQRCVGGLCTPRSSAVALGEPVRDFQAVETVLSSPDDMAEQLIVLAAQPKGVGLKRYYLPDYRIASDDIDEELGAFRVDTAIRGTLQLAAANRDPTQGLMRFAWAQQSEGGGVRSVLLDIKTPWISATETLYKLPSTSYPLRQRSRSSLPRRFLGAPCMAGWRLWARTCARLCSL